MLEPLTAPAFSSYRPEDVAWLLTDVTGRVRHTAGEVRELELQMGGHYSESLPVEYEPTDAYGALVLDAIGDQAERVATAVARVADRIFEERGPNPVLVSLARAGTPAGVLIKRWMATRHGIDAAHYTMSIILGRGLDPVAIAFLLSRHTPESIVFVDGWTGKGSIARELRDSLNALGRAASGVSPDLAVLADPAGAASMWGTRRDTLIPSAMLNSTVSGLVSRTVYSTSLIPRGQFHGAEYEPTPTTTDLTALVIDSVVEKFVRVPGAVADDEPEVSRVNADVERIGAAYGVEPTLIKAGICETTRVLLRRLPCGVVVRELGDPETRHLEQLALERDVRIHVDPTMGMRAAGLIARVGMRQ